MIDYITHNWMDVLGLILGLLYILLELKANILMWVVGMVMPAIYTVVLYQKGVYADCAMEVYYFLAGAYGLCIWLRGKTETGQQVSISHTPASQWLVINSAVALLWLALYIVLIALTDSKVPVVDSFTTAASIVAMWMLSRKYIEQWWAWLIVDLVSAGLYVYKGIYGRALLYGLYTVLAVYGYRSWRKQV